MRLDSFAILAFFGTLHVYLAQRMVNLNSRANYHSAGMSLWMIRHQTYVIAALIVAFVIAGICFLYLNQSTQIGLIVLSAISMMYALPLLFWTNGKTSLRDYGVIKPFVLGVVWGLTTALLPLLELDRSLTTNDFWIVLERVVFLIAICVPFDIKDMEFDAATMKYQTLPNQIGTKATRTIAVIGVVVAWNVSMNRWLFVTDGIVFWELVAYSLSYIAAIVLLLRVDDNSNEYYYTFWLDGLLLLQPALLLGLSLLW